MLSERSRGELEALVDGPSGTAVLLDREQLNPFLVGVHRRGEEVVASDLAGLLEGVGVPPDERGPLTAYVEAAFNLLDAYDASLRRDDEPYGDDVGPDDDSPMGTFVI